jgi:MFS family permease
MAPEKELNARSRVQTRFYYGYVIVALCFSILLATYGVYDSFGIFLKPLLLDFGWSRAITSSAYSLSWIIFGLISIAAGGLTDKFGPRVVLTVCGLLLGIGYLLMSQLNSLWQLYLFEGVLIGIGMSSLYGPILSLVARWFVRKRGQMTGVILAGMGIGQLGTPLVVSRFIANYGWQLSYIWLGIIVLLVVVISTQFLKRDPSKIGQLPYGANENKQQAAELSGKEYSLSEALHTWQLWIIFFMKLCFGYYMFSILVHIVPHATDLGISPINAANILAIIGGGAIIGSFVLGRATDKFGPRIVYIGGFLAVLVSALCLMQVQELWLFYLFGALIGLSNGGNITADSPLTARLFGLKSMGSILGVGTGAFSIGCALGPIITGYIYDSTGSYQTAFLVCGIFALISLIFILILRQTKEMAAKI